MHKFSIILLLALAAVSLRAQNTLLINELMQSNVECIMDGLNDFPDSWVELYNPTSEAINLSNYKLGISRRASEAYPLPSSVVNAGERFLVWCDKESTGRHTPFRLESGNGCCVYLFQGNTCVDSVSGLQKQPSPDIAYGRQTDGAAQWGYQAVPTPGAANCGTVYSQCLPDPVFSVPGRVITTSSAINIGLRISAPDSAPAGTVVRFTTDGTEPTDQSPVFSGSLHFSNTRHIKARLFCDGYLSPKAVTQSYIFLRRAMDLPVISIVAPSDYFYDNQIGILVEGSYGGGKKNYEYNWRRPINIELFDAPDSASVINQLCEARVAGAASRGCALKSLALYANKRFGTKRFRYEFFPEDRPGQTNYKSIVLRNAGNDFDYLYMRDAIIQRAMAQYADMDWQAYRPAIVYINGEYKGILNIRERANEDNVFTNYDELEDITMMENTWNLQAGSWDTWNDFINFCHTKNHTWAEYNEVMDCIEYINVMIDELFFNNQDFPGNNIVYWRPNTAHDGLPAKWRLLVKDTDFGLGLYGGKYTANFNTIAWMYNPDYDPDRNWANSWEQTRMFRYAMQNADFQREFCDRAAIYMGDFLNFSRIWGDIWQKMYNDIHVEYSTYHRPLYNRWWPNYGDELYNAKLWLSQRPAYFAQHIAEQYGLGTPAPMTINHGAAAADTAGISICFNGVALTRPVWDGLFYKNRPIRLTAEADNGNVTFAWEIKRTNQSGQISTETLRGPEVVLSIPADCRSVAVSLLTDRTSALDFTETDAPQTTKTLHDGRLYIHRSGTTYDVMGRIVSK